jgi:outer membrane murein-binding lipoprotein Lpp
LESIFDHLKINYKHMKIKLLSAAMLALVLVSSCSQKNDQEAKIQALEEKIAQLQNQTSNVTPVNAQATTTADPSSLGTFGFTEMEYDFGTINEGQVIEHVFNFTNNGQAPLVISNITASCGCTSPDWTKAPVNPGEKGFVKVVFNSAAKSGSQAPTVTIQANTDPTVTRLRMKGTVTPKLAGASAPTGPLKR